MAPYFCWRCRPHFILPSPLFFGLANHAKLSPRVLFSTTPMVSGIPDRKKSGPPASPKKGDKTFKKKKKAAPEHRGRPPAPGERKAMRKRVVVSNTNALEVKSMQDMGAENLTDFGSRSRVIGIPGAVVDRLRAMEAFKPVQSWALFRKPCTLMRAETVEIGKSFEDITRSKNGSKNVRKILVGGRGTGKSIYLLQAMTMAFLKDWIVVHIPEAQDLTNAHTAYGLIPGSNPAMYSQGTYTASLLGRIATANPQLSQFKINLSHNLPIPLQSNIDLSRLCHIGSSDSVISHYIFNALIAELTAPSRPPLLITLDGLQHIMTNTAYMSPSFTPIHAHDLHLPNWFLSHLSGTVPLPNGGAVIAAATESNRPSTPTLNFRIRQLEAQQAMARGSQLTPADTRVTPFLVATGQESSPIPRPDPYYKYDQRVLEVLARQSSPLSFSLNQSSNDAKSLVGGSDVEIQRLGGLSKDEAKGLIEYWALSGILRHEVSERFVGEKWAVSGGGIVGELERGCIGMRL